MHFLLLCRKYNVVLHKISEMETKATKKNELLQYVQFKF